MQKQKIKEQIILLIGLGLVIFIFYITGIGCPIRWLTGITCAGCGLTRACLSALQLDFQEAFYYHPLFWLVPVAIILYLCKDKLPHKILNVMLWGIAGAFLVVYVVRMIDSQDKVVVMDWNNGIMGRMISYIFE